jgi:hypothetical protein
MRFVLLAALALSPLSVAAQPPPSLTAACAEFKAALGAAHAPGVPYALSMAMTKQTVDEAGMCASSLPPSNAADLVHQAAVLIRVHVAPYQP